MKNKKKKKKGGRPQNSADGIEPLSQREVTMPVGAVHSSCQQRSVLNMLPIHHE